jgi:hypothetical protein
MRFVSLQTLDVTHLRGLALYALPNHHRNPFDRMLIAQAPSEQMTLLTADRVFQKYKVEMKIGVGDGDRTRDIRCHRPTLYQLSYSHHRRNYLSLR